MKNIIIVILLFLSFSLFAEVKPIITVLDFKTDGVSKNEMISIISFLSSALFKTDKFIIIDVHERNTLLEELEFSISDCSDDSCLLKIGRLLSAEFIVKGNIGRVGSRYLLTIKLLETETGRTVNSVEGVYTGIDEIVDDLYNLAANLAGIDVLDESTEEGPDEKDTSLITKGDEKEDTTTPEEPVDSEEDFTDSIDTSPEIEKEKSGTGANNIAFGAGAGASIPLGTLKMFMHITFMPIGYLDYYIPVNQNGVGIGLLFGFQPEDTTEEYPLIAYELDSVPIAFHFRLVINRIRPLVFAIETAFGMAVNNVRYAEGEESDITTTKFFLLGGISPGISFSKTVTLFLHNNFFAIFFDENNFSAYFVGLAVEIKF